MYLRAVMLFCVALGAIGIVNKNVSAQTPTPVLVNGHVLDGRGAPVGSASVQLLSLNGTLLGSQVTDAVGFFSFRTLGLGPYMVQVSALGETEQINLDGDSLQDISLQLDGLSAQPAAQPADGPLNSRVSVNDLQAPGKAKSKLAGAQKAMLKREFSKAWKLVNEAISVAPNWGRAYMMRGVLSMESHDFASAKADLATAVARDPDDSLALTELGKAYAETGDLNLSETYLRRALTIAPVEWPTYFEMASLDLQRGNFAEAETMADHALTDNPPAPPAAHFLAAEAAYHLHEWATATQEYRSFVALEPAGPDLNGVLNVARKRLANMPH